MWPNPKETPDFVTFTKEIFNEKLNFLCSANSFKIKIYDIVFLITWKLFGKSWQFIRNQEIVFLL